MPTATATRERLTFTAINLHHPLDYYFGLFLRAKETEGLKPRTLNDHKNHYRYLQRWLTEHYPTLKLGELTSDHVRQYVQHMLNEHMLYDGHPTLQDHNTAKGLTSATVNIRTRTLKCFLRFLHDEGYLQPDLASRVKLQKVKEDTISGFEKEQVLQLLAAPNQREYTGFRDYVLLTVLFDTGLRINEALNLTVDDLNLADRTVTVRAEVSKNGKSRTVPVGKRTVELLAGLVQENKKQFARRCPSTVFLLNNGKPLKYNQSYERIRLHGESAGIVGVRVSPHTFRHTFATLYVKNGGDPFSLQKILGHHDISMVRKYVQLSNRDLQEQHAQSSPLVGM
ncbi:tyrosine-type recombinase/integrase [Paenibacillus provencensis]|uniref:Tyrosine-type recombinase/integrase n=1 Tax=Paenibacillus provencensis TaxID=441151 RepID=A0ABW3Q1Y7_9BACL|nr:tyrosine-type recombinase/integrase [Paenibacillus sp. MER 78]MCM3130073.1 tyrosine-type recombinase/integrase [Paenibacillus sp. MER 78]